ncbi:MAG: hypothetical protein U0794_13035 [Isosphaeraceae bacterium]
MAPEPIYRIRTALIAAAMSLVLPHTSTLFAQVVTTYPPTYGTIVVRQAPARWQGARFVVRRPAYIVASPTYTVPVVRRYPTAIQPVGSTWVSSYPTYAIPGSAVPATGPFTEWWPSGRDVPMSKPWLGR